MNRGSNMRISTISTRFRGSGFTLIELMMVVAIIAILAAIAVPAYSNYVKRSRIIDGTTKLGDYRSKMEKYFMDNRTYLAGATCGVPAPGASASDSFSLSCGPPVPTATSYTLVATGIAAKGMAGFVYTIDQTNAKASSGPSGWAPGVGCWAVRADGSC